MRQGFNARNYYDEDGNPTGGFVEGVGIDINWQNGPLGRGPERKAPNGAFVEDVIAAAIQRIEHYQTAQNGKFNCAHNAVALTHLMSALDVLNARTKEREARQVEGTHEA